MNGSRVFARAVRRHPQGWTIEGTDRVWDTAQEALNWLMEMAR